MLKAARLGDQISHTQQRSGLITGMIVGALIVGAVVLAVASGGTAIPALIAVGAVATGAAVGGGIGRLIGGEQTVPKGVINKAATTVFINSRATPAARACVDTALCQDHTLQLIATGSTTVAIEGFPAARVSDIGACSFAISQGSANVFIGGGTGACAGIEISPEVEPWLEWTHRVIGWVGGLCLLGPAYGLRVAVASLIGSEIGAHFGGRIGQQLGGKWGGVIGSFLGGIIGGGIPLRPGVRSFINRLEVDPNTLGMNGGNIRLRPEPPTGLSRADYERLRGQTPSQAIRDRVNENVTLPMDDPALPGLQITKPLHADHIVPMKTITEMDGFSQLSRENQLRVLNNPDNFVGLSETANTSKGSKTFSEWTEYKKGGIQVDETFRQTMIQREQNLQGTLQQQIRDLLNAQNNGGGR